MKTEPIRNPRKKRPSANGDVAASSIEPTSAPLRTADHPTALRMLAVARRLLEQGRAENVSMRRIGDELGLSAMALYRHFPNRIALLDRVTDDAFAELAERWSKHQSRGSLATRWRQSADRYLDFALEQPHLFDHMFSTPRTGARQFPDDFRGGESPTLNLLAGLVKEGIRSDALRDGDVWEIAFTIAAHSHGLIALYRGGRAGTSVSKFRQLYHASLQRLFEGLNAR